MPARTDNALLFRTTAIWAAAVMTLSLVTARVTTAQDKSVRPGINDSFQNPDVGQFKGRFEVESREVFAKRVEIVAASGVTEGKTVADIGAGTGLFTRLFAEKVGPKGRVIAVDIAPKFIEHIRQTAREANLANIDFQLCKTDSTELPKASVDFAFICDTYHHFEFPTKTMRSLHQALRPGGKVVLIDFRRVEGESSDWTMEHVRAGQEVFEAEVVAAGFRKIEEKSGILKENYLVIFEKVEP